MPPPARATRSWRIRRLGPPATALSLQWCSSREPGPGEAQVAVGTVGLNFPDLLLCAGRYQQRPDLPFSPGFEGAGTVVAVGEGAKVSPGQRVIVVPELPNGALQESLTVPSAELYPVPDSLPLSTAAVLHIAYQTAHLALHHRARTRPGETVLVTGAAGGVGSAAIQLARLAGNQVIAVVKGPHKAAACRRLGANVVIDLSEDEDGWQQQVRVATGGRGADVIIDVVGGEAFDQLRRLVAFEGRIVAVGFTAGTIPTVATNHPLLHNYSIVGLHLQRYRTMNPALLRQVHDELVTHCIDGSLTPEIYEELPAEQAPDALALLTGRQVIGRVVLQW